MNSVARHSGFVLFWISVVTALHTSTTAGTGSSNKKTSIDDLKTRLDAVELDLKKLPQLPISEIQNEACSAVVKLLTEHYSSIDERLKELEMKFDVQMKIEGRRNFLSDLDEAIKIGSFKSMQDKLIQSGDISLIPEIVHKIYANSESNLDVVLNFSESLPEWTFRYEMLKALYDELRSLGQEDPRSSLKLLQALDNQVIRVQPVKNNDNEDDLVSVGITNYRLVDTIKRSGTDYLIKGVKSGAIVKNSDYRQFLNDLYEVRPEVSDEVVKSVINGTFDLVKTNLLLSYITKTFNTPQAIEGISALFWKIGQDTGLNNTNILEIASNLVKLQKESASLDATKVEVLDKVIEALPICARNIYFSPIVCIWNRGRKAYLEASVTANNHDKNRRNIFTNPAKDSDISGARWIVEKLKDKFYFKSKLYPNEYMYTAQYSYSPDAHYVFNWLPGNNTDSQSAFRIELRGDHCYLKSFFFNEYLMASSIRFKKDNELSYVFAWINGGPDERPEFEWQIHNCE